MVRATIYCRHRCRWTVFQQCCTGLFQSVLVAPMRLSLCPRYWLFFFLLVWLTRTGGPHGVSPSSTVAWVAELARTRPVFLFCSWLDWGLASVSVLHWSQIIGYFAWVTDSSQFTFDDIRVVWLRKSAITRMVGVLCCPLRPIAPLTRAPGLWAMYFFLVISATCHITREGYYGRLTWSDRFLTMLRKNSLPFLPISWGPGVTHCATIWQYRFGVFCVVRSPSQHT